jgi:CubicO group peptidase (beta-lactamase class C family)
LLLAEIALAGIVDIDDPLDTYLPNGVWPPARDAPISLAELASQSADQASMSERTGGSWQCANRPVLIAARIEL